MPLVRCPDCLRNITVSQEDLTRVIECSVCEARFGPLIARPHDAPPPTPPPAPPQPPPASAPDEETKEVGTKADPTDRRVRPKRLKPKERTQILPIVVGVLLGLTATAAVLGAIYVLIRTHTIH
jgi:hypothetical protein